MEMLGKELVIGGLAIMAFAQLTAAIVAFRANFRGMCSLIVPGYLPVAMCRAGYYWRFLAVWGTGVLAIVVGTVALS